MEKATLQNLLNIHASLFILHSMTNLKRFSWPEQNRDNSIFLAKDSWVDLEEDLNNDKSKTCWDLSNTRRDLFSPSLLKDYREVMHENTKVDSAIFDYVAVVKPILIAHVSGT